MNGYRDALSISEIEDSTIKEMEIYVKNVLRSRLQHIFGNSLPESDLIYFFGQFANDPSNFMFMAGERCSIIGIAKHTQKLVNEHGHLYFGSVDKGICASNQNYFKDESVAENKKSIQIEEKVEGVAENKSIQIEEKSHTHFVLNMLLQNAETNVSRKKNGYRFCPETQKLATYLRMVGGRLTYETLQKNLELALPSIVSTNRYLSKSNCIVSEGILRCNELVAHLEKRNLPKYVAIAEDGTRICGRAQYDKKSNKIIGFVQPVNENTGMPDTNSFFARNTDEIINHFSNSNAVASFVNVIMAQPISSKKVPAFPLLVFGSDNR